MKIIIGIIILIVIVYGLDSFFRKDTYIGFYYPDASNLFYDIQSKNSFDSLEACRNWVNDQIKIYNRDNSDYDYECGKNCNLQNGQKPYVCEETLE